jgi:hypothetical protein
MIDTNLEVVQGDDVDLVLGPVELPNLVTGGVDPIDLTVAGVEIRLTAKERYADTDAAAAVEIGTTNTGLAGITKNLPATASRNYATASIPGADTAALDVPANGLDLRYDVQLKEAGGRKTTVQRGQLRVLPEATKS